MKLDLQEQVKLCVIKVTKARGSDSKTILNWVGMSEGQMGDVLLKPLEACCQEDSSGMLGSCISDTAFCFSMDKSVNITEHLNAGEHVPSDRNTIHEHEGLELYCLWTQNRWLFLANCERKTFFSIKEKWIQKLLFFANDLRGN